MDSMRSLNKSLPKTSYKQPPEQLLSAFKAAALSVTNLYKTAATDQDQARRHGYQEALDELLHFLDDEGLGLGDGEGWKVRQWATERYDGSAQTLDTHDSDEDGIDVTSQPRGSSPTIRRKSSREALAARQSPPSTSPVRTAPALSQVLPPIQEITTQRPEIFTFRTPILYPSEAEMQSQEPSDDMNQPPLQTQETANTSTPTSTPTMRVGVIPRGSRTPHRTGTRSTRHSTRSAHPTRSLGPGAGSKRVFPLNDFFDISGSGDKDASGGGGKRGRSG